jgi:hypothetical protein
MPQVIFDGGNPAGTGGTSVQIAADTVSQVVGYVQGQLRDNGIEWAVTDGLLPYLNLALKLICDSRPDAFTVIINTPLTPGVRQALPPSALSLVDVESILDIANNPVSSVLKIAKEQMDRLYPGWYSFPNPTDLPPQFVVDDDRNPFTYYLFPPPPGNTTKSAALICAAYPVEITAVVDGSGNPFDFPLDNSYVAAAVDFTTAYCLDEQTTIQGAQAKAATLFQRGYQKMGITKQVRAADNAKGA